MNSDVIKLLPDSVANQIAAGEVIQRPASVVKELVENAVDAGAKDVQIIVRDAGRTLIQVVDDGVGMSDTDARLAFERHSTSKIRQASDLFTLHTMGFRGEALASIVAVAQVEMRTMRHGDQMGTRLVINGSQVESQEPLACAPGTNIMVKNLFFNVPARRKFLKKDAIEMANILHEFERLALVNTEVSFTLIHNDTTVHRLLRGTFKQRICELFGRNLEQQLLPVATDTSLVKIEGYVARPEHCRRRGALQYFMVNGRNMRHPYYNKAVAECYQQLIAADCQPSYFLNFTVAPDTIDVNIHPQKHEIKFENELPIRQILTAAIRETLGKFNVAPAIDFDTADAPEIPAFRPEFLPQASTATTPTASRTSTYAAPPKMPSGLNDWEKLYESFNKGSGTAPTPLPVPADSMPAEPQLTLEIAHEEGGAPAGVLQLKNRYLLTSTRSGLMVIDQHRAHVRVLYERYLEAARDGNLVSQAMLFPESFSLSAAEHEVLTKIVPELARMGFELAYLGGSDWALNGAPSVLATGANPVEILTDLVGELAAGDPGVARERLDSQAALQMARAAAIRNGQQLSAEEMENLIAQLMQLSTPALTPDGLATMAIISEDELAKLFT